jgi:hypothetical protein
VEHFEEIALDAADKKPAKWLRYVDETFLVWPHGSARLQQFLHHLTILRPAIKFTMEIEANDTLPFLDVFVMKRGPKFATKMYGKDTYRYLHFNSKHPHHVKSAVVHSLPVEPKLYVRIRRISARKLEHKTSGA